MTKTAAHRDPRTEQPAALGARMTAFVAAFGLAVTAGAFAIYGTAAAASTGVGAIVALANFSILRFIVVRVVEGDMHRKLPFLGALFLKMGALMGFVYFVIAHRWVEPISFTAGLSSLVAGLLVSSFLTAFRSPVTPTGTEDAAR